jgi:hypothetical protein
VRRPKPRAYCDTIDPKAAFDNVGYQFGTSPDTSMTRRSGVREHQKQECGERGVLGKTIFCPSKCGRLAISDAHHIVPQQNSFVFCLI